MGWFTVGNTFNGTILFMTYAGTSLAFNNARCIEFSLLEDRIEKYTSRFIQFQNLLQSSGTINLVDFKACLDYFSQNYKMLEEDVSRCQNPNFMEQFLRFIFPIGAKAGIINSLPEHEKLTINPLRSTTRKNAKGTKPYGKNL